MADSSQPDDMSARTDSLNPSALNPSAPVGFFTREVKLGALFSCCYGLTLGLGIAAHFPLVKYGWTLFIALPFITGCLTATMMRPFRSVLIATLMGIAASFGALALLGLEGIVCLVMAAPLMAVSAIMGTLLGLAFRAGPPRGKKLVIFPALGCLLTGASAEIEERNCPEARIESFSSELVLPNSPTVVWEQILEIDRIEAAKPILLRIGLPVPMSCRLDGSGVGSTRTCYFDRGEIREVVSRWEPASRLEMRITACTLPGRHWLKFLGASYSLEELPGNRTRLIRETSIESVLRPSWYWRPMERLGVTAEHEYLFRSLTADIPGE